MFGSAPHAVGGALDQWDQGDDTVRPLEHRRRPFATSTADPGDPRAGPDACGIEHLALADRHGQVDGEGQDLRIRGSGSRQPVDSADGNRDGRIGLDHRAHPRRAARSTGRLDLQRLFIHRAVRVHRRGVEARHEDKVGPCQEGHRKDDGDPARHATEQPPVARSHSRLRGRCAATRQAPRSSISAAATSSSRPAKSNGWKTTKPPASSSIVNRMMPSGSPPDQGPASGPVDPASAKVWARPMAAPARPIRRPRSAPLRCRRVRSQAIRGDATGRRRPHRRRQPG